MTLMKAVVRRRYGSTDALAVEEVPRPDPAAGEVLVRIRVAALNFGDWYALTGTPYLTRMILGLPQPRVTRLGVDFAGTVEAVGAGVNQFQPGDDVFGARTGALAAYVCVGQDRLIVAKPDNLSFEQAAAVPVAALTALQGLRDKGRLRSGERVLINGASGGVGTFAVQIAKALGGDVTAVCSTGNVELVRSLGADRVVDYSRDDFVQEDHRYDLVLDIAGGRTWSEWKRVLSPFARLVIVGGRSSNRIVGPLADGVRLRVSALGSKAEVVFFIAKLNRPDLLVVTDLVRRSVKPMVDRSYPLSDVVDAFRYLGEGHARAKVVVTV